MSYDSVECGSSLKHEKMKEGIIMLVTTGKPQIITVAADVDDYSNLLDKMMEVSHYWNAAAENTISCSIISQYFCALLRKRENL